MEIEAKFALPDMDAFKRLQTLDMLAGFALSEVQVRQVHDTFLDTADRQILAAGHVCRRREQDGEVVMSLKRFTSTDGAIHRREELQETLPAYRPPAEWPAGPLREKVLELIGDAPLIPLFDLQQTRIVRPLTRGQRLVAELSLDRVTMTGADRRQAYSELEVELAEEGTEHDLATIVAHLEVEWALRPEPRSKFERALGFFEEASREAQNQADADALELPEPEQPAPPPQAGPGPDAKPPTEPAQVAATAGGPPVVQAPETPSDQTIEPPLSRPPKTPGLEPDDSMAEAARKTFYVHFQRMAYHEPGTRLGEDIEELHDMRVATRRMRAAVPVFGDYLDPKQMKPYIRGLRRTGRALGAVRDLDVFGEKMQAYLDTLPAEQQGALDPLLAVWAAEREAARERMLTYLDSDRYRRFKERFGEFLQYPGAGALPVMSEAGEPRPHRLRHVVPIVVYDRLAHVRAYDEWVAGSNVPLGRLHQLRIAVKRLRYTLEFFQEVLGPEAGDVIDECKTLQDHLGDLQDAGVASNLLRDFLTWGTWGHKEGKKVSLPAAPVVAPGVAAYLAAKQSEIQHLASTFPDAWARFQSPAFSRSVAAAVEVL
ncbi:MAG: CHAD domain-containing protein [Anaerolineae bacterium]